MGLQQPLRGNAGNAGGVNTLECWSNGVME